jgi:hypothetical protein
MIRECEKPVNLGPQLRSSLKCYLCWIALVLLDVINFGFVDKLKVRDAK